MEFSKIKNAEIINFNEIKNAEDREIYVQTKNI